MKKETLVALFIAFLMVSSVLGFVMGQSFSNPKTRYNDFVFEFRENRYYSEIKDKEISFYALPETLENVELSEEFITVMQNTKMIYFTSDVNDILIEPISVLLYDISTNVFETDSLYVQPAFTVNGTTLPKITCEDAIPSVPVVYVKSSNETSQSYNNNCLILEVQSSYDVAVYRDRILYGYYNVI